MIPFGFAISTTSAGHLGQQTIGALRQRLQRDVVAILVDDERRNEIAFAVHQPIRAGVDIEPRPKRDGLLEPRSPEAAIDGDIVACQNPQRYLRAIAVKSASQKPAVRRVDAHDGARLRTSVGHVAAVHPEMAVLNPLCAAGGHDDCLFHAVLGSLFYVLRFWFMVRVPGGN